MANVLTPIPGDPLDPGINTLGLGQELRSLNGTFQLTLQAFDGDLVLYINDQTGTPYDAKINRAIWTAITQDQGADHAIMQSDGNFVVYGPFLQNPLFATNTNGNAGAFIVLQDDGNLVIYTGDGGTPLWASNTSASEAKGVNA